MPSTAAPPPNNSPHTRLHSLRSVAYIWGPAFLGVCVIAVESTATFTGEHTSRWLRPGWQLLFGPVADASWERIHHVIRKTGHFVGYGTLSLLFLRAWWLSLAHKPTQSLLFVCIRAALLALLCTFLTASADEFHQSFIPGRTGVFSDVLLDTAGGIAAHLLCLLVLWPKGAFANRKGHALNRHTLADDQSS